MPLHRDDVTLTCPYNKSHEILPHRMAQHLIKCRRQHPSKNFKVCRFNAIHHVDVDEMENHELNCPDRATFMAALAPTSTEEYSWKPPHPNKNVSRAHCVDDNESWENFEVGGSYDPIAATQDRKIIRSIKNVTRSERIQFRKEERERHNRLNEKAAQEKREKDMVKKNFLAKNKGKINNMVASASAPPAAGDEDNASTITSSYKTSVVAESVGQAPSTVESVVGNSNGSGRKSPLRVPLSFNPPARTNPGGALRDSGVGAGAARGRFAMLQRTRQALEQQSQNDRNMTASPNPYEDRVVESMAKKKAAK